MGKMVETGRTDMSTFIGGVATRLKNDSMALRGLGRQDLDVERRDLDLLADSLEHTASLLDVVKKNLCVKCRMLDVVEHVTFGTELEIVRKSKKKGKKKDEQEKSEGREGRRKKGRRKE